MDFVSLETETEANSFLEICKKNANSFDSFTHIGALTTVAKSHDKWYWVNSGRRITYPIKWSPGQPDNSAGGERCLSIIKQTNNSFLFNDLECSNIHTHYFNFVCQQEHILLWIYNTNDVGIKFQIKKITEWSSLTRIDNKIHFKNVSLWNFLGPKLFFFFGFLNIFFLEGIFFHYSFNFWYPLSKFLQTRKYFKVRFSWRLCVKCSKLRAGKI